MLAWQTCDKGPDPYDDCGILFSIFLGITAKGLEIKVNLETSGAPVINLYNTLGLSGIMAALVLWTPQPGVEHAEQLCTCPAECHT